MSGRELLRRLIARPRILANTDSHKVKAKSAPFNVCKRLEEGADRAFAPSNFTDSKLSDEQTANLILFCERWWRP
jgi:hypothetical protein